MMLSFGGVEGDIFKLTLPYMYIANSLHQLFLHNTNTVIMGLFIDFQLHLIHFHVCTFAHVETPREYLSWLFPSCFPNPVYLSSHPTCFGLSFNYSDLPVILPEILNYRISCIIKTKEV